MSRVGRPRTPNLPGVIGFSSALNFTRRRLAFEFAGELLEGGHHLLARAAPFGPEVDDDGACGPHHFGIEGIVGDFLRAPCVSSCLA